MASLHLRPHVREPLERGDMPEDTEEDKEPAEPRETVPAHRSNEFHDTDHHDEHEPVRPAKEPAVIPPDTDRLGLGAEITRT